MPNPLDYLKKAGSWAVNPLVSKETIAPMQDALDAPALDRSPMEARLRGFGAGAMEGLRGMTSPLELGSMALGGGALGALGKGAGRMAKAVGPTLDVVEPSVVKQVAPAMDDVNSLIGDLQRNLAKVPNRRPPMETLGERAAEFAPVGGEAIYNAGRAAAPRPAVDGLYSTLLQRLGGLGR